MAQAATGSSCCAALFCAVPSVVVAQRQRQQPRGISNACSAAFWRSWESYSGRRAMLCEPTIAYVHEAPEASASWMGNFEEGTNQTVIPT